MRAMTTLRIQDVDDTVVDRLRTKARINGISVEEQARRIIADGTTLTREEALRCADEIRARSRRTNVRSARLIRSDRGR
jgi:plasmid stability protein